MLYTTRPPTHPLGAIKSQTTKQSEAAKIKRKINKRRKFNVCEPQQFKQCPLPGHQKQWMWCVDA